VESIQAIVEQGKRLGIPGQFPSWHSLSERAVFCEPTSGPKLLRAVSALQSSGLQIDHITPNALELGAIAEAIQTGTEPDLCFSGESLREIEAWTADHQRRWIRDEGVFRNALSASVLCKTFWVKNGSKGLLRVSIGTEAAQDGELQLVALANDGRRVFVDVQFHAPLAIPPEDIVSTTGAGDTLAGSIAAGLATGLAEGSAVKRALLAVDRTLRSRRAVGKTPA